MPSAKATPTLGHLAYPRHELTYANRGASRPAHRRRAGYPGFEVDLWWGLFAPAKTPKEMLARLAGWFTAGMLASDIKAKLVGQGFSPVGICGVDFGTLLRKQYDDYGRIVRDANIKAE